MCIGIYDTCYGSKKGLYSLPQRVAVAANKAHIFIFVADLPSVWLPLTSWSGRLQIRERHLQLFLYLSFGCSQLSTLSASFALE